MADLATVIRQLAQCPALLRSLTLPNLFHFVTYTAALRNHILLAQPAHHHPTITDAPPTHLPHSVLQFLADSTGTDIPTMQACWTVLKEVVWNRGVIAELTQDPNNVFYDRGYSRGFSK